MMKKTIFLTFALRMVFICFILGITGFSEKDDPLVLRANDPAVAAGSDWELQWSDEFVPPEGQQTANPDPAKWGIYHAGPCHRDNVKVIRKENEEDGYLSLMIREKTAPNGNEWSWGMVSTAPSVRGKQDIMGPDRKLFSPPEGGEARLEICFRGTDANNKGMMVSGIQHAFWLKSKSTAVAGTPVKNMVGEIDIMEHASPAGGKPMKNCIHITEFTGDKWGQGEKRKSSDWELIPTGKGEMGYFDDTKWHILVAEWSRERVVISMDCRVMNDRYNKPGENGLKGTNYNDQPFIARYWPFDEKFPMALMISSQIFREGSIWGGIGPAENEPTDYDRLPMEVCFDFVRFYTRTR